MDIGWLLSGPLLVADVPVEYGEDAEEEWVSASGGDIDAVVPSSGGVV